MLTECLNGCTQTASPGSSSFESPSSAALACHPGAMPDQGCRSLQQAVQARQAWASLVASSDLFTATLDTTI